jgi:predicted P-loop ATPase
MKNAFTDLEHLELVASRITEGGVDITSDYQDWIRTTFACASLGEQARECYHTICRQYPGYSRQECDKKFDNCLKTGRGDIRIATLFQMAKEKGIDTSLPKGRRPKTQEQKAKEQKATVKAIREQLQTNRQWRYNVLSGKTEYSDGGSEWKEVDDRFIDTILTRLREAGLRVKDNELRSLVNSSDFAPDYAPHLEWLNSLKPWNPDTDPDHIHDFFVGHMEFGPLADAELYDLIFHRWIVSIVALWRGEIDANPLMPTFCGPQQIGKSFIAEHTLPPSLQRYQTAIRPNDPINTDTMLTFSEVLLVIFDEISINSDSKSNMMKFLVTSGQTNLRDAYGHYRKVRRRMASAIATTNYTQFIREAEGNRRYIGIDLVGTKNIHDYPLNYEGAYAQAVYLLEHGYEPKPTYEESQRISQHNRQFMTPNDCEEALRTFVRHPAESDIAEAYASGDLQKVLNQQGFHGNTYNVVNIGRAMKSMGFESRKIRGISKYRVVLADAVRQQRERQEDAVCG